VWWDRFWRKVEEDLETGCWVWRACRRENGYGQFNLQHKRPVRAHRLSYRMLVGPTPSWLEIDHLCRNRACVNPAHMELVTRKENVQRSPIHNHAKTYCVRGHSYSEENTYRKPDGRRECRICRRDQCREWVRRHGPRQR